MNRSKQAAMGKKFIVVLVIGLTFASVPLAHAQQPAKAPKIGFLATTATSVTGLKVLERELRRLGYVEGQNIVFESRHGDDNFDRLPALADELIRLKADVLVTPSTPAAQAAKNATKTVPIVFLGVSDPVVAGLVDSLARPGGNITRFTNIAPVLAGKRLELLKDTVPKLIRVAVLWDPKAPGSTQQWKESKSQHENTVCNFILWRLAAPTNMRSLSKEATKARSAALALTQNP